MYHEHRLATRGYRLALRGSTCNTRILTCNTATTCITSISTCIMSIDLHHEDIDLHHEHRLATRAYRVARRASSCKTSVSSCKTRIDLHHEHRVAIRAYRLASRASTCNTSYRLATRAPGCITRNRSHHEECIARGKAGESIYIEEAEGDMYSLYRISCKKRRRRVYGHWHRLPDDEDHLYEREGNPPQLVLRTVGSQGKCITSRGWYHWGVTLDMLLKAPLVCFWGAWGGTSRLAK